MEKMPKLLNYETERTLKQEILRLQSLCLQIYMDYNKIPYQNVGVSAIDEIRKYLLESKVMPAHLVPTFIAEKYGLVDNRPKLEDVEKETKRLQELANQARNKIERR